jgi:hypothetical protein
MRLTGCGCYKEQEHEHDQSRWPRPPASGEGLIGSLHDDAELLDQIVEHAMKVREERPWRLSPHELRIVDMDVLRGFREGIDACRNARTT